MYTAIFEESSIYKLHLFICAFLTAGRGLALGPRWSSRTLARRVGHRFLRVLRVALWSHCRRRGTSNKHKPRETASDVSDCLDFVRTQMFDHHANAGDAMPRCTPESDDESVLYDRAKQCLFSNIINNESVVRRTHSIVVCTTCIS